MVGRSAICWPVRIRDRHFVVEIDDDRPRPSALRRRRARRSGRTRARRFTAAYRVGNGPAGNVGAGAIAHLVDRDSTSMSGGIVSVAQSACRRAAGSPPSRSPRPSCSRRRPSGNGSSARSPPRTTRRSSSASSPDQVQRAAATLRWNGSWYEVLVAVDPLGPSRPTRRCWREIASTSAPLPPDRPRPASSRSARHVPLDLELQRLRAAGLPARRTSRRRCSTSSAIAVRPTAGSGFFHPDRLSFGDGIFLSVLVAAAQAVAGVESVDGHAAAASLRAGRTARSRAACCRSVRSRSRGSTTIRTFPRTASCGSTCEVDDERLLLLRVDVDRSAGRLLRRRRAADAAADGESARPAALLVSRRHARRRFSRR